MLLWINKKRLTKKDHLEEKTVFYHMASLLFSG